MLSGGIGDARLRCGSFPPNSTLRGCLRGGKISCDSHTIFQIAFVTPARAVDCIHSPASDPQAIGSMTSWPRSKMPDTPTATDSPAGGPVLGAMRMPCLQTSFTHMPTCRKMRSMICASRVQVEHLANDLPSDCLGWNILIGNSLFQYCGQVPDKSNIKLRFRAFNVTSPFLSCPKKTRCLQRVLFATKMFRSRRSLPIDLESITRRRCSLNAKYATRFFDVSLCSRLNY